MMGTALLVHTPFQRLNKAVALGFNFVFHLKDLLTLAALTCLKLL